MTFRLFRCSDCGHRMRLGRNHCGKCLTPKPVAQRPFTVWLVAIAASLAATLVAHRLT